MKIRGFEKVINIDENITLPKRGTQNSAGYDFFLNESVEFSPGETIKIKTSVKAFMQEDEVLMMYVRSSAGIKGLSLVNTVGIIDSDYYGNEKNDGEIMCFLKNNSSEKVLFEKNDRLVQGMFQKYLKIDDENDDQIKRTGGFGHTNN